MSKKVKVLVSVLVAVVLLTVGSVATVMAQEEPTPPPETEANGLLARVARILGIPQEDLVSAFKQAQQEMKVEAFSEALDEAVEKGLIDETEAGEIKEWWDEKPEALGSCLSWRAFGAPALCGRHMLGSKWGVQPETRQEQWQGMMQRPGHAMRGGWYRLESPRLTD